jgi:hypothetical protein
VIIHRNGKDGKLQNMEKNNSEFFLLFKFLFVCWWIFFCVCDLHWMQNLKAQGDRWKLDNLCFQFYCNLRSSSLALSVEQNCLQWQSHHILFNFLHYFYYTVYIKGCVTWSLAKIMFDWALQMKKKRLTIWFFEKKK